MRRVQAARWLIISGLSVAVFMLGACTLKSKENAARKSDEQSLESQNLTFTFYGNSTQPQEYFNRYYGDALRKRFPNYTFQYIVNNNNTGINLASVIASGQTFDFFYQNLGIFENTVVEYGMEVDLTELLNRHQIDTSKILPTELEGMKANTNGKLYGLPLQRIVQVTYYNKAIFDKFGVAYPKDGMTWDDAAALANRLTRVDNNTNYFGYSTVPSSVIAGNQLSLREIDDAGKPTINTDPRWRTFYENVFLKMMSGEAYRQELRKSNQLQNIRAFYEDQNVAMFGYQGQLQITDGTSQALQTMNWDMAAYPAFKEAPGLGTRSLTMFIGLTKMSKNVDAAMGILKFMISEEFQTQLSRNGWMPILNTPAVTQVYGQNLLEPNKHYAALFAKPAPTPNLQYSSNIRSGFTNAAVQLLKGETDMNTAFREAEEAQAKILEQLRAAQAK
jgi:multiple sugar transport system substrate-binding protein